VLFLKAHDTSVLLTGDIETQTETALIKTNLLTQVDILKVAHHGSKSSSTPAFLDKVAPEVALISVGQKNRFGHPSLDVISRLKSIGTRVWRTDEHGEIVVRIDAQKYEVSAKR
jgi:competence protein ComEC